MKGEKHRLVIELTREEVLEMFGVDIGGKYTVSNEFYWDYMNQLAKLKALEQKYLREQAAKKDLNEELEAEGFESLEDKIKVLGERAQEEAEKLAKEEDEG